MKVYSYARCSSCDQILRDDNLIENYAIYARKALQSPLGFDDGMANQVRALFNLAAKKDLKITDVFTEYESGMRSQRIKLGRLLSMVKKGEIQGILCTSWDRISRSSIEIERLKQLFKREDVKVFTL